MFQTIVEAVARVRVRLVYITTIAQENATSLTLSLLLLVIKDIKIDYSRYMQWIRRVAYKTKRSNKHAVNLVLALDIAKHVILTTFEMWPFWSERKKKALRRLVIIFLKIRKATDERVDIEDNCTIYV